MRRENRSWKMRRRRRSPEGRRECVRVGEEEAEREKKEDTEGKEAKPEAEPDEEEQEG